MASMAVSFVIEKLGPLIVHELKLPEKLRNEVLGIRGELESIRSFLKDAEARAVEEEGDSEEGVKTWVKQVREEAYRIEDVIDEFSLSVAQLPRGSSLVVIYHKVIRSIKKLKLFHGIATEIESIKSSLEKIQRRGKNYRFSNIDEKPISGTRNVVQHDSCIGSFFIEDAEVVGIESARDELIDLLVNGRSQRSVIAIVGEGGSGKTTLAGKVHDNKAMKKHFDCQAWITVGKEYIKKDILLKIIMEFYHLDKMSIPSALDKMGEKEMITMLREYLMDKRYMVMFDDVWNIEFWSDVEHALLDNNQRSRIMLTTRNKAVADFVPPSIVRLFEHRPLSRDQAWILFRRKVFGSDVCPPELKELSEHLVDKCGGIPLAIVAVGGLMSNKYHDISEWQKLLYGLGSKLGSDPHLKICNRVLSEGYYNLPHHLKSCLLYFGLFPVNYPINCGRLIRLWIAEGFVPYSKYPPSEILAEEYLTELVDRNLVKVIRRDSCGRAKKCGVHDLMHEIILREIKELGFCGFLNGEDLDHCGKVRRISIHRSAHNVLQSIKESKIRSVFIFNIKEMPKSFITTFFANFMLMKVLDLQDAPIEHLPEGVGDLLHLHYLSVSNTKVKVLPKSTGKLLNLETLDLKHSLVKELPIEIRNLKKLRHLLVYQLDETLFFYDRGTKIREGLGSLTDMQKLCFVQADSQVLKELKNLKQLRKLGIDLINGNGKDLSTCIENMNNLLSLGIRSSINGDFLDPESIASPPRFLKHLYLRGNMKKLPDWIPKLQHLVRMGLDLPGLKEDPMTVLQALPNLLMLRLTENYHDELIFKEGSFPKLKLLSLADFKGLKLMMIEKGAMPNLRALKIGSCPQLKEIPTGIEYLRKLKVLEFRDMLNEIYCMVKKENWVIVSKHITEVCISYRRVGKYLRQYIKYRPSLSSPEDLEHFIEELEKVIEDSDQKNCDDAEVVGIESTRDQLVKLLVNGGLQHSVIVVLGEGGSGKTTLSGKIQNNEAVKKHFDCQAWITMGKEYTKEDILRRIILELFRGKEEFDPRQINKMEEKELITKLRDYIKDKSYMVVFDDVWKMTFGVM